MRTSFDLVDDERAVMIFVLLGTVLLVLSMIAGAYFVRIRLQSQREISDTAGLKELDVRIDNIEDELESAAWEAGQEAVEKVRRGMSETGKIYTTAQLRSKVGENTTRIFEEYFEENHEGTYQVRGYDVHVHLRPIRDDRPDIEILPLYIREERDDETRWEELPGFFKVERRVHVDVVNERTGTFSSRKIDINRTVETHFFLLAERMRHFRPQRIRRSVDLMSSAYLHMKIFDGNYLHSLGVEGDWFDAPFSEHFETGWLDDYDGLSKTFGEGEERDAWEQEENQVSYASCFTRDKGTIETHELLTEEEVKNIAKLALLLEQARVFRSMDTELLHETAEFFETDAETLSDHLGEGVGNKVNLEALIIRLFQEKGTLSEKISYPGPFLNSTLEGDFLSVIKENEDWVNTSFGMMKRLVQGELLGEDNTYNWKFEDLSDNITSLSDVPAEMSYLRTLISLYSNVMDVTLDSFKVEEPEVRELVERKIGELGPLPWMENLSIIGPNGVENVTRSILYTAKNLSVSLGFRESESIERAVPLYYIYFLSDWGFNHTSERRSEPEDRLNTENMQEVIQGKITDELRNRRNHFEDTMGDEYDLVQARIEEYNETMEDWDDKDREGWREVWDHLNQTKEVVDNLSSEDLFHDGVKQNATSTLHENHSMLADKAGEIEDEMQKWDREPKEHTLEIIEMEKNFTKNKWLYEVYQYLLEGEDGREALESIDDFLTASSDELIEEFDWILKDYEVSRDINIPPSDAHVSVGHAALGNFTGHLKRDFLLPLNHSNSYNLFKRMNLNIFDLVGSREDRGSRLWSILLGEGDPYSDHLIETDSIELPLEVEKEDIHSDDLSDIDTWWIQEGYDRSIEVLEETKRELSDKADSLMQEEAGEDSYWAYGNASFYRTSEIFLSRMVNKMQRYRDLTIDDQRVSGNAYKAGEAVKTLPVYNLPLGGLTVWNNRSLEYGSSYTLDLDVRLNSEDPLIKFHDVSETTVRGHDGESSSTREWIDPFSEGYDDHYRTVLSTRFSTSEIDLTVKTGESKVISSEKYSSGELVRNYAPLTHCSAAALYTPMPLLEKGYKPLSSAEHEIRNVSFSRNIFNSSENEVDLTFEVQTDPEVEVKTDLLVEVMKIEGVRSTDPKVWGRHNHYRDLKQEDHEPLFQETVQVEGESDEVEISFDISSSSLPEGGMEENHLVLRVKQDIVMDHMQDTRNLTQSSEHTDSIYSYVPSFTTAEQTFLLEEDKEAYMGVFSIGSEDEREGTFQFIERIPSDSWLIEKENMPFLIGFDGVMEYRNAVSGRYGSAVPSSGETDTVTEVVVDPEASETKISRLPESRYRNVLESSFVTAFMAASGESNRFYPVEVLPQRTSDEDMWETFRNRMKSRGSLVGNDASIVLPELFRTTGGLYLEGENTLKDPGLGTAGYIYYDLESVHDPRRADRTLRPVEAFGEVIDMIEVRREDTEEILGMGEESEPLRETGLFQEFLTSDLSKREELFLTACRAGGEIETVEELKGKYPCFGRGSIALSLDILGEDRTEQVLKWFEGESYDEPVKEFRAFLSFNGTFLEELPKELGEGNMNYKEAVEELSEELGMDFTAAREWSIKDLDDVHSLGYILERFEDESVRSAVSHGFTPTALNETEYEIDIDEFSNDLDELSSSRYFVDFVQEMNSGNYENLPSFYFAARSDGSDTHWMPFGGEGAPLLIDDQIGYYNMSTSQNFSESRLKNFIDHTMDDFAARESEGRFPHKERALIILDGRGKAELDEEQKSGLAAHMKDAADQYSPDRRLIGAVELRTEDEKITYLHL